jgi:hypothetical protein
LIVTVRPATVSVPLREPFDFFAATAYDTVPFPLRLDPDVMVIQLALLLAVQAHPDPVVTETVPFPPGLTNDADVGLTA